MKKVLIFTVVLICLISSACAAENPYKDYPIAVLRQMIITINDEIVSRSEWKYTDIPSGVWTVGKDIPVGEYSISMIGNNGAYICIQSPSYSLYDNFFLSQSISDKSENIGRVELKEGYTVEIQNGTLRFARPITLGF